MAERFGKYEVVEKIGEGGFGTVYKGRDPVLKRFVAVKTCSFPDAELRRRFLREAEISAGLQHPNVVMVHDFGEEDGEPYLVQEFLPGRDLDEILSSGEAVTLATRVEWLRQVAEGLRYAHGLGVVHRDVKPGNVRIQPDGRVRILDFGIAKLVDSPEQLTRTGMSVGTAAYLSPEQLAGQPVDHRADVFAFGTLAYEVLSGTCPFEGESLSAIIYGVAHREPEPLDEIAPGIPPALSSLVQGCLVKERERRIQDFDAVLLFLDEAADDLLEGGAGRSSSGPEPTAAEAPAVGASGAWAATAGGTGGPGSGAGTPAAPSTAAGGAPPAAESDRDPSGGHAAPAPAAPPPDPGRRGIRRTWIGLGVGAAAVAVLAVLSVARWGATSPGDEAPDAAEEEVAAPAVEATPAADERLAATGDPGVEPGEGGIEDAEEGGAPGEASAPEEGDPPAGAGKGDPGIEPGAVAPAPGGEGVRETGPAVADPAGGGEVASPDRAATEAPAPAAAEPDPARVLLVVYGEAGTGAQAAETAFLEGLRGQGLTGMDRASLDVGTVAPAGWDPGGLGALARRGGAGVLVLATFESDVRPAPGGFVTGTAGLDVRAYATGTGELLATRTLRVGGDGVPGKLGPTPGEARIAAGVEIGERAARWLGEVLGGR